MDIATPILLQQSTIGTIVTLKTHPFSAENDNELIVISGESTMIPPLMVIVEILAEQSASKNQNPELPIPTEESLQCKCVWYSTKSLQFEDAWISSKMLKIIKTQSIESTDTLTYGTSVIFKTAPLEVAKKKSSFSQSGSEEKSKITSALLSFTAPVMQIVGLAKNDCNEPSLNKKISKVNKYISKQLVKCKFYNSKSDKYSEAFLPVEALIQLSPLSTKRLNQISQYVSNTTLLKTKRSSNRFDRTIVKPLRILYNLGTYYLEAKDYLQNKVVDIRIEEASSQFEPLDSEIQHLPMFDVAGKKLVIQSVSEHLDKLPKAKPWRIKYKDVGENRTTRTIYDVQTCTLDEKGEDGEIKHVLYIKGKCILRSHEERIFRVDRIQLLQVLDLDIIDSKI